MFSVLDADDVEVNNESMLSLANYLSNNENKPKLEDVVAAK